MYFYINSVLIAAIIGVVSTVWFMIGGFIDTRRLFRDLAVRLDNPLDNGQVENNVSLVDRAAFGAVAGNDDKPDPKPKP
jgi:hypothetical protein